MNTCIIKQLVVLLNFLVILKMFLVNNNNYLLIHSCKFIDDKKLSPHLKYDNLT